MKNIELNYLPGDEVWVRGQHRICIIENVMLNTVGNAPIYVTYEWYNLDVAPDVIEVWDDGSFTSEDVGKTVFNSLEEYEKAFPEDFQYGEIYVGDELRLGKRI